MLGPWSRAARRDGGPTVSVVIPSYRHAPFVQECVRSVLDQDFQDFEIVVTDDGSGDATAERLRELREPRLRLKVFAENRGACVALNDAIERARGRYIAVLNSDDRFLPGKLRRQVEVLNSRAEIGAVFGLATFVDERGAPFADAGHKDVSAFNVGNRSRHEWLRHFFDHGNALCHPTALVRREVYREVGLYDPRLAQVPDLDQWIRVCMVYEIDVLSEPLTAFRIRDAQQNASAARPEVVIRDAWERACVLRHYLRLPEPELHRVFPEFVGQPGASAEKLARYALLRPEPFFRRFALDAWFQALPDGRAPQRDAEDVTAWRRFIEATGLHDLHRLYP
jgi:hypothetical protein